MIVVIPSNRQIELAYLTPLIESGARFIVVDDSDGTIAIDHPAFTVYNWNARRRMLGELDAHLPRHNGACRAFGFYIAWRDAEPDEAIVALDDDCRIYGDDFATKVEWALSDAPRPVADVAGEHLNILDLYEAVDSRLFPRGFPYSARGSYAGSVFGATARRPVAFSLGLWKGVFDVNAVDKICGPAYAHPDARLKHPSVLVPPGKLISVCSMSMQFRRELIPAVCQLPMHVEVTKGGVVDRYGDIWGGFILKTLMDAKGDAMAVGEPMIEHLKEGDYLRNIWQENICHQLNDEFLDILAEGKESLPPASYLDMMSALTDVFRRRAGRASPMMKAYLGHLTPALAAWTKVLG